MFSQAKAQRDNMALPGIPQFIDEKRECLSVPPKKKWIWFKIQIHILNKITIIQLLEKDRENLGTNDQKNMKRATSWRIKFIGRTSHHMLQTSNSKKRIRNNQH